MQGKFNQIKAITDDLREQTHDTLEAYRTARTAAAAQALPLIAEIREGCTDEAARDFLNQAVSAFTECVPCAPGSAGNDAAQICSFINSAARRMGYTFERV